MKRLILLILLSMFLFSSCSKKLKQEEPQQVNIKKEKKLKKTKLPEKLTIDNYKHIKKIHNKDIIKGIYLTTYAMVGEHIGKILDVADSAGVNTIVFDVKNMKGELFLPRHQKEILAEENVQISLDIAKTVKALHKRDMKAVARVVMFHNQYLAENYPEFRPTTKDGDLWLESKRRKPSWLDPSDREVQNRLIRLIDFVCASGVDEIQMDYIRFPTQGNLDNAIFDFQLENEIELQKDSTYIPLIKEDVIEMVVGRVDSVCSKYDVTLAADIFAITAWQQARDVQNTGQNILRLSKHLDYIHPMIYSSHFAENFGYRENIYNEPYLIVYWATHLTRQAADSECEVVPYIQANSWKINYKKEYVVSQVESAIAAGGNGFLFWNSKNSYYNALGWLKNR